MSAILSVFRREFGSYFATPLAVVFIVIFLVLAGAFTFYLGDFFAIGQADLHAFFRFHPWLYLLLVPAVAMRLWAEERKTGTLELLLTQPLTIAQAVIGKFLAAWAFISLALILTFPIWLSVNWLGQPDNGVILASYLGSALMAGALLAVGGCLSATTKSQVIAFILTLVVCLLLLLAGFPLALDLARPWASQTVIDAISGLSFLSHFQAITRGVLDFRDVFFFLLAIATWLFATVLVINAKRT